MKLVEQSAELWRQEDGYEGMLRHIERCGRVAYTSEMSDNIEGTKKFVKNLIDKDHTSVLEHGTVYLKVPFFGIEGLNDNSFFLKYSKNPYSKMIIDFGALEDLMFITTNYRVEMNYSNLHGPVERFKQRYTMHLVTSIGIVRELLRHRKFSFTNESTRYIRYDNIEFIKPHWYEQFDCKCDDKGFRKDGTSDMFTTSDFKEYLMMSQSNYAAALIAGMQPQQAREILPLCTKSEIVMTGFEDDWKYFFDLRLYGKTGKPHPDMVILAQKIKDEFERNGITI